MNIWTISDTHGKHKFLTIPKDIDMVIHAGDMGTCRDAYMNVNGMLDSLKWFRELPITHKILIPGNHCTSIERKLIDKKEFDGITFLNHESAQVAGLKIFGSGYTPSFGQGWAYNVNRNKLEQYWKDIPEDTDILVTHGPPAGILDLTINQDGNPFQCGCKSLWNRIKAIGTIRYSIFGHIHQESGCHNAAILKINGMNTTFVNASVLDLGYEVCNNGFVIDI